MDGYLGQLEQRLDAQQAQINELNEAAFDLIQAKRKQKADAAEAQFKAQKDAADKERQAVEARMKQRDLDRAAAVEQAKVDAEKKLQEEFKAKTTDEIMVKMRADMLAKAKSDADEEARVLALARDREVAAAAFKSRFGDTPPIPPGSYVVSPPDP